MWGSSALVKNALFMPDGTPTFLLFQNAQTGWQGNHHVNNHGYPTLIHDSHAWIPRLNHEPALADENGMGRFVFYPIAIGLFVLLDMALRAHGH